MKILKNGFGYLFYDHGVGMVLWRESKRIDIDLNWGKSIQLKLQYRKERAILCIKKQTYI